MFARILVFLFCMAPALAAAQDRISRLPLPVAQALAQAGIPEASVGIYVQDVTAERPLIALGDERALNPASTVKLLTTFAALDRSALRINGQPRSTPPVCCRVMCSSAISYSRATATRG
jgi:D-alanyl-D-alanine carboxypeptidase